MADKKPAPAPAAAPADAAAKPKVPLVPIIGAAVGSAVLVAGIMFFMMPKPAHAPAEGDEAAEGAEAEEGEEGEEGAPKPESRYIEIKDPLVVNLTGGSAKYLQVQIQLATKSEEGQKAIEAHLPAIRSALLVMFRQLTNEELSKPDVMVTLQDKALGETNKVLEAETGKKETVTALLFTSFVTQ
ncbi:MAG: flagellar basal body-associated FliL family protein [Silanimonas sp.]